MSVLTTLKLALLVCNGLALLVGLLALTSQRRSTYLIGLVLAAALVVASLVAVMPALVEQTA